MKFQWILIWLDHLEWPMCKTFKRYHDLRHWMRENNIHYFDDGVHYFKRRIPE